MSEASGIIALKLSDDLTEKIMQHELYEELSEEIVSSLLSEAQIEQVSPEDFELTIEEDDAGDPPSIENGYLLLSVWGESWLDISNLLVQSGKCIEFYGWMEEDSGLSEYYTLSKEGKREIGSFHSEGVEKPKVTTYSGDEKKEEYFKEIDGIYEKWRASLPPEVTEIL